MGWWLHGTGTIGPPHGDPSGQDLAVRARPTPSQRQGTGAAPAPCIGHLPGHEDVVAVALPAG